MADNLNCPKSFKHKPLDILKKIWQLLKKGVSSFDEMLCTTKHSLIFIIIYSFALNILLEATLRKSFVESFKLVFSSPLVFFLGMLIVLATFSIMYLFRRRLFVFTFISILWYIVAYVSYYLMCQRTTPFNSSDFRVLKTTFDIIHIYLSVFDMILLGAVIVLCVVLLILVFIKCKKASGIISFSSLIPAVICSLTLTAVVLNSVFVIAADRFDNLPNKYREHGFVFCFLYSIVDNGIDKPNNYTKTHFDEHRTQTNKTMVITNKPEIQKKEEKTELIDRIYNKVIDEYKSMPLYSCLDFSTEKSDEIIDHLTENYDKMTAVSASTGGGEKTIKDFPSSFDQPNIIFLQLESFYDVTNIEGYEYSDAPHPIYSMLKEELPGGKLTVPSIGAGTANTEFEILTGMDVSFFGIAEYPYLSVLQNSTCESMAYNAKQYGYTTHAIHNHKGTFYDRNKVFPNLGFDTFTSLENMPRITRNRRNWAKDSMLIDPILASLNYSGTKDLIYAISVQPHGRYPSESTYNRMLGGQDPKIKVSGNEDNPENPGFTYYVNQLNEVDTFIGNLILELSFRNEPTVLVLYGDHLPAFSVQKYWQLKEGDCYQTDYIIWNNCGIDFSDAKDLSTFQLNSYIFSKVGISEGDFNKLNQLYLDHSIDDYAHLRHIYQYATLYDNALKKDNSTVKVPTYSRAFTDFGVVKTVVENIYTVGETTFVTGDNFNEFSRITINGEYVETDFITTCTLSTQASFNEGDIIGVIQQAVTHIVLGQSKNLLRYSPSTMVIPEELHEQYLTMLIPVVEEDTDEGTIEDATLEFETGADDMNMIQHDINDESTEGNKSDISDGSSESMDGALGIVPEEEIGNHIQASSAN